MRNKYKRIDKSAANVYVNCAFDWMCVVVVAVCVKCQLCLNIIYIK